MAVLQTGQTFTSGDQVTADKLMDIANDARFITTANETADGSTIQVDAVGGYLKVPSNGIGSNELSSDASVDANRAVGTNHIKDGAVTAAKLDSAAVSVLMPTATVLPYAGSAAPTGYLVCAGQSVLVADYGDLHGVIGYTYGGSGASFNLPDLRGRVIAGLDNMGGTTAGRLTGQTTLGGFTGTQSVTLQLSQIPSHEHGYGYNTVQDSTSGGDTRLATSSNNSLKLTSSAGGGQSHPNVQPTMTLNYIIKT
jgi:microcystin-dependent protein